MPKPSGTWRATWLKSAVVRNAVVIRSSRSHAAKRSGERIVSRSAPTRAAPLRRAPHTSKVAASKAELESCATRSPGPSCT